MPKEINVTELCGLARLELDGALQEKIKEELEEFISFSSEVLERKPNTQTLCPSPGAALREDIACPFEGKISDKAIDVPLTVGAEE